MIVAETDRLLLRHFTADDGAAMERVFGDTEVMRYGPGVQTAAWVRAWIARRPGHDLWAVARRTDGEVLGYCGLTNFPDIAGRAEWEVGYRLARRFWGHGYATEAARAVRDHAFDVVGLTRLIALVDPANLASIRVAEKLGMRYEKDVMLEGYTHPDRVYAMCANERRIS